VFSRLPSFLEDDVRGEENRRAVPGNLLRRKTMVAAKKLGLKSK
jgi:hypothetical protein